MLPLPFTVRDVATPESAYCPPQIRLSAYGLIAARTALE
jgi:hypothetical protein